MSFTFFSLNTVKSSWFPFLCLIYRGMWWKSFHHEPNLPHNHMLIKSISSQSFFSGPIHGNILLSNHIYTIIIYNTQERTRRMEFFFYFFIFIASLFIVWSFFFLYLKKKLNFISRKHISSLSCHCRCRCRCCWWWVSHENLTFLN